MALAVPPKDLTIEAPIPGRSLVGIYVPKPNFEKYKIPSQPIYPAQEEKSTQGTMRADFDGILSRIRAVVGLGIYALSRLLAKLADAVYPR